MNVLELVPGATAKWRFCEFVVDGSPLRHQLIGPSGGNPTASTVPVLVCSRPSPGFPHGVEVLAGVVAPGLPDGRVEFYACEMCVHIDCGSTTGRVTWTEDTVTWSDFGYQVSYEPYDPIADGYTGGPFVFDRATYLRTLQGFRDELNAT